MANAGGKMTTGTAPRLLQLGVDNIIEHQSQTYKGEVDKLFTMVDASKGFYELVQMAGMGMAGPRGEGDVLTYDTYNQDFNSRFPAIEYEKSARITAIAIEDNLYLDMIPEIGAELFKAQMVNKDYQGATILNTSTTQTWSDGVALMSTSHPINAGGTNSNRLSPDLDLSEDAVEQAVILIDNFVNPDGILSDTKSRRLVVPTALKYVADRIYASKYRTASADNDVNAVMNRGDISDYVVWKRLSGSTTWFITTDAKKGLLMGERRGVKVKTFNDPYTDDVIVTSSTRFVTLVGDWRCVAGSVGP